MSREFHETTGNHFMWQNLRDTDEDRPVTGDNVADSLRELYIAIADLEYHIANHQAADSNHVPVIIQCYRDAEKIERAAHQVIQAVKGNAFICDEILKRSIPKPAPPSGTDKVQL